MWRNLRLSSATQLCQEKVCSDSETTICSKELDDFLEALKNSAAELDWIGVNLDPSEDSRYSRSSENLQDLLASFSVVNYYSEDNFPESTGQLVGGDAWYSNFRSKECRNGNCPRRVHAHKRPGGKKKQKSFKARKHKSKNSDENVEVKDATANSKLHDSDQRSESEKSGSSDPDYDDYDSQDNLNPKSNKQTKGESNKQLSKDKGYDRDNDLKDQLDESQNDLSHEADYKLSKSEQDAMDKKARANGSWPLRHPDFELNLLHRRQQPDYLVNEPRRSIQYHQQDKRSLNPTDEIKLRVSNRMMSKGFGPSLPSDALIDHKRISVEDILDNSPVPTAMLTRSKRENRLNFSEIMENLKENLREEFDQGDLSSFFHLPSATTTNNITILKDEDFVHTGRKLLQYSGDHDCDSEILSGIKNVRSPKDALFEDTVQVDMDPELLTSVNSISGKSNNNNSTNSASRNNIQGGKDVRFKFQVAINATILNSTSSECAKIEDGDEFEDESVEKREVLFPSFDSSDLKQKSNEAVQNTIKKAADVEQHPLDELMTGRFSSKVVNAIYKLAKYNKDFRQHIWPGLKNSCAESQERFRDISFLKTSYNQEQVKKTEMMVREMMQMINTLIEQQIRSRTCIPLRPDLQAFYNQVLQFRSKNDEEIRASRKRKTKDQYEDWHNVVKRRVLSEPKIRRTKSVVKKLLNQFDYLPTDEQERNKDIKDMMQMQLVYLRELERETDDDDYQNRRKRSIVVRSPSKASAGIDNIETGIGNITPDFEKLVRTAELIRKNSLVTDESYDYLSFQSDDYL